jgi:hypothetical protein
MDRHYIVPFSVATNNGNSSIFNTGVTAQAGEAAFAAAIAFSASSFVQQGTFTITSSMLGLYSQVN